MVFTIQESWKNAQRHAVWLALLAPDRIQLLPLQAFEIGFGERRIEDHVCKKIEGRIEVSLERRKSDARAVQVRPCVQLGSQLGQLVTNLDGGPVLGAFIEHVHGELRGSGAGELIGCITGINQQIETDQWDGMPLGQNDLQSIGELACCNSGNLTSGVMARNWRFGSVDFGLDCGVLWKRMNLENINTIR